MTDDRSELQARAAALRRVVYGTPDGYASPAADELVEVEAALARLRTGPAAEPDPVRELLGEVEVEDGDGTGSRMGSPAPPPTMPATPAPAPTNPTRHPPVACARRAAAG